MSNEDWKRKYEERGELTDEQVKRILAATLPFLLKNRMAHSYLAHIQANDLSLGSIHVCYLNPIYDGCGAFRILSVTWPPLGGGVTAPYMLAPDKLEQEYPYYPYPQAIEPDTVFAWCEPASKKLISICEDDWMWSLPGFLTQEESEERSAQRRKNMQAFLEELEYE